MKTPTNGIQTSIWVTQPSVCPETDTAVIFQPRRSRYPAAYTRRMLADVDCCTQSGVASQRKKTCQEAAMSDDAHENRSQLLAEIDTLRQRLHAYERRPAERLLRAQKRLREAVWSMESSEDLQRVLSTLKESLQELELPFLDCGVNLVSAQSESLTASINSLNPQGQWEMNADSLWGQELVAIFWQDGRPVYRRNLDTEDAYGERELFPRYFGHPVRSVVDVPFAQGQVDAPHLLDHLGVVSVAPGRSAPPPRPPSRQDRALQREPNSPNRFQYGCG